MILSYPTTVFAVLGPWRGGTSLVAGVLQSLGVYLGSEFVDAETGYCTYEDVRLRRACLLGFDERPEGWSYHGNSQVRSEFLSEWLLRCIDEARSTKRAVAVGGKHPILCKLVPELFNGWTIPGRTELKVVSVVRSRDRVHQSWTKPHWPNGEHWWPRPDREAAVDDLIESRDQALQSRPHITICFESLRKRPQETLTTFVDQCGLPTNRLDKAIELIRPSPH